MTRLSATVATAALVATTLVPSSQGFAPLPIQSSKPAAVVVATTTNSKISSTQLQFGIPTFQPKRKNDDDEKDSDNKYEALPKKDLSLAGIVQLITAGAGAPFLGDYEGVDKETGKFMFSLEANNLVDENGNSKQTQMPYFEQGWVDPEDERKAAEGFKFPWQK